MYLKTNIIPYNYDKTFHKFYHIYNNLQEKMIIESQLIDRVIYLHPEYCAKKNKKFAHKKISPKNMRNCTKIVFFCLVWFFIRWNVFIYIQYMQVSEIWRV